MKKKISLTVNGKIEEVAVEPWWSLAQLLRHELHLTGTKVYCETGECGVCTVLVNGEAVKSCIYPAMKAKGKEILTIEGLQSGNAELHPLQKSFIEHFAVQCGYCTPGMIMTAKAFLDENSEATEEEVRIALSGNLCRCTGYVKILDAVMAAKEKMR
jgi:carbon-monoxide dehydrogenase small subunit